MLQGHLQTRITPRKTPIGTIHILWHIKDNRPVIYKVILPGNLNRKVKFTSLPLKTVKMENLALDLCSNFQRKVLNTVYKIPAGFVSTYACIAKKLSTSPRSIGRALATNPFPIIVPCHRIVKSDGSLGGYQGKAWMKKRLLETEGIKFDENNIVDKNKILRGVKS